MLIELSLSALWFFAALFGLFRLSEAGFLAATAEQSAFFAARAELVGRPGNRPARFFAETAGAGRSIRVGIDRNGGIRILRVALKDPTGIRFEGRNAVPSREGR